MTAAENAWGTPLFFLLCFILLWVTVCWVVSHACGWTALAKIYRATEDASGIPVRLGAARIGRGFIGRFRNVLTLWVGTQGVQLRMLFLFRVNNPALFIPWSDISVSHGREFFSDYVELHFSGAPEIPLRIYAQAAQMVRAAAAEHWPAATAVQA